MKIGKKQRSFAGYSGEYSMYGSDRKKEIFFSNTRGQNPSHDSHVNIDY